MILCITHNTMQGNTVVKCNTVTYKILTEKLIPVLLMALFCFNSILMLLYWSNANAKKYSPVREKPSFSGFIFRVWIQDVSWGR